MKKILIAALLAVSAIACVKTGSVAEKQPVASLASYKTASLSIEVPGDMKNGEQQKTAFSSAIARRLKEKNIFTEVRPDGGELAIKVKVTKVDTGSDAMRALGSANAGSAEVFVSVELADTAAKSLGAFDVTGNSKKNVQTSVGGVNMAVVEDATGKALDAAADEIAEFLSKKR
jgi:hypothetical protein